MTGKNYKIGSLNFKTKKACEKYIRSFLTENGCGFITPERNNEFNFINDILNNHPSVMKK